MLELDEETIQNLLNIEMNMEKSIQAMKWKDLQ